MRIVFNLHKIKDMELYAWLMGIENRRSLRTAAIKSVWRDYLDGRFPARADLSSMSADTLTNDSLPETVSFQVVIGKTDRRLAEHFEKIPFGRRAVYAKAVLRIMTAPYAMELLRHTVPAGERTEDARPDVWKQAPVPIHEQKQDVPETEVLIPKITPQRNPVQGPELEGGGKQEAGAMDSADALAVESTPVHASNGIPESAAWGNAAGDTKGKSPHSSQNGSHLAPRVSDKESMAIPQRVIPQRSTTMGTADLTTSDKESGPSDHLTTSDDDLMTLFGVDYG